MHRYRTDIFFRSKLNVIALQLAFGVAIFAIFWFALQSAQENIANAIASGIIDIVDTNGQVTGTIVLEQIQSTRQIEFLKIFSLSFLVAVGFGYVISRATLSPARNALFSQKRFISNVAHELRTPLSVIKTRSEVLLLEDTLSRDIQDGLNETVEEVDRASGIIDNLLSIDSYLHFKPVGFERVELGKVADDAVQRVKKLAEQKHLALKVTKRGSNRMTLGNTTAIEQVLVNLLKNAIAHTSKGGSVDVIVEPDYRGFVLVQVKDTGSGIAEQDLFYIFEPYYRAKTDRSRKTGGSGLGLTIVSEIVKAHRGKIAVQSTVGHGTVMSIRFPCIAPKADGHDERNALGYREFSIDFSS